MSKLLLDDKPLIILPSLANKVGLNEAIILQQLHYWLGISTNRKDGETWVYNTYDEWQEQFPFWSISTIRRTITKLENQGLIIVGKFNKLAIDNTKWYRIDYFQLESMNRPSVQNEQTMCSKRTDDLLNMNTPLPENTSENTTKSTKRDNVAGAPSIPYESIINYLNGKAGTYFKHTTKKTQALIKARFKEHFTAADFKKVIDNKVAEWLTDPEMNQYLRPETLFGTKFESYLNQKPKGANHPGSHQGTPKKSNDTSGIEF